MQNTDVLELQYSRPVAITVCGLAVFSAAQIVVVLAALLNLGATAVFGLLALVIMGPIHFLLFRFVYRALTQRQAIVTLDEHGITDIRQRVEFVPWEDVRRVRVGAGSKAHYLCVELKQDAAGRYTSAPVGWRLLMRFAESLGDWNVQLLTLSCSRSEVAKTAEGLRKAALRRQVERLNSAKAA